LIFSLSPELKPTDNKEANEPDYFFQQRAGGWRVNGNFAQIRLFLVTSLPNASVYQIKHILDELGWCSFGELRATPCIVNRLYLLDHHEPSQR
jgi:hypothetical protein